MNKNGVWAYHGTNRANALKIIKEGICVGTHFAHHLEDALEFGGSWVFRIKWEDKSDNWQFLNMEHILPERIERLTQYQPVVRIGTQPHLTRKLDSAQESKNLDGIPLVKSNKEYIKKTCKMKSMRVSGMTYQSIADKYDMAVSSVHERINK